jgi:hypothetical protein
LPSYATSPTSGDGQIRGRILSFDGGYVATVTDEKGYVDNVRLHQGTIINPTGLTLAPGMTVSVLGYDDGSYFSANEIDTPYTYYTGIPYYDGHPWDYYGPTIGLGFYFGNVGWWHGNRFRGGYHYDNGARIYSNVRVNAFYRGGTFSGRNYVANPASGGYVRGAGSAPYGHSASGAFAGGHSRGGYSGGARASEGARAGGGRSAGGGHSGGGERGGGGGEGGRH